MKVPDAMLEKSVIVLDIDGTVTDSAWQHQAAFEQALGSFPFDNLDTNWNEYPHHTDTGIFAEAWARNCMGGAPPFDDLESRYARAYDTVTSRSSFDEINGARQFLEAISDRWIVVFATGSLAYGAWHKLSVLGLRHEDHVVVTASEFCTREDLVESAVSRGCAAHGVGRPAQVLSIGDGVWDLTTAQHLGYDFLGIGTGPKADQLRDLKAVVYDDFVALAASNDGERFCVPSREEG